MNDPLETGEIEEMRARLQERLDQVAGLRPVQERRPRLDALLADLDRQIARRRQPAVVCLVGPTGAGKSTLLNALAGRKLAEEGVDRPTTRVPVVYAPQGASLGELLHDLPGPAPRVHEYEPWSGPEAWRGQIFIDAPDLNSVEVFHREVVAALAERSDVLIAVLHRQAVVEEATVRFLDEFHGRRRLLLLLNRADELIEASRAALLAQIRELAASRWGREDAALAVSAREARGYDWPLLIAVLQELARAGELERLRGGNAQGVAAKLQEELAAAWEDGREDLEALPGEVAAGLADLAGRTGAEVAERLQLRAADFHELYWREAAHGWDGPGGYALRVHGLTSLGLGAGALLARRSPLLAAGAAAGSLAADQVGQALRRRRLADARELLPLEKDFRAWYADALGSARLRAGRLAGDPAAFAVPEAEPLYPLACQAVEEAWQELADKDLPRAAQRSVPRPLRLLLDAPVYALGAWVAWQAAAGFFQGRYAGLDFLINAALLLCAYLFVLRFGLRRLLRRRADALLRSVTAAARDNLGAVLVEKAHAARAAVQRAESVLRSTLSPSSTTISAA